MGQAPFERLRTIWPKMTLRRLTAWATRLNEALASLLAARGIENIENLRWAGVEKRRRSHPSDCAAKQGDGPADQGAGPLTVEK